MSSDLFKFGIFKKQAHILFVMGLFSICLLPARASEFADTVARVKQSVVGIGTVLSTRRPPFKFSGTGFAVGDGNLILTNAHVVSTTLDREKFEHWVVVTGGEKQRKVLPVKIVAKDEDHDLALLKIDTKLPPLILAPNARVREGNEYGFTGFPIGAVLGLYPVTHRAYISAITPIAIPASSTKQLDRNKINRLRESYQVLQLDAIAYPGNSGSPLYDPNTGEVIGILNMVFVKQSG
ncbi:MAG TPA: serine protease, partial [Gammaproteobacteria bacterium]|nr:serine protease [Gammaproteobacteria bacterium]